MKTIYTTLSYVGAFILGCYTAASLMGRPVNAYNWALAIIMTLIMLVLSKTNKN